MRRLISLFSVILFISFFYAPAIARAARCNEVYFNKDARSFFTQFPFSPSDFFPIFSSATADLNNDGNLDLVVGIQSGGLKLVTFFGDGQGKFVPGGAVTVQTNQPISNFKIRLIDLNNDSVLDLLTYSDGVLDIYFGNNTGGFTYQSTSRIFSIFGVGSPVLVDVFDINGDGRKDILISHIGPKSGGQFVRYHLSSENYTFPSSDTELFAARSLLTEDFNNDGRRDIAATFPAAAAGSYFLRFYYNQGNGGFNVSPNIETGDVERLRLAHDFDGNGTKDIVATSPSAVGNPRVSVLYNNANQSFSIVKYPMRTHSSDAFFNLNDFNGDGVQDFAVFSPDGYDVYLRKRVGGFTRSSQNIVTNANAGLIADFNNDKTADLLRIGSNGIFQTRIFQLYEGDCFRRGRPDTIDYIGSGLVNFASWQPETGRWTYNTAGFQPVNHTVFWGSGALGDIPVPGDYDGDGVTDTAVFRQPTGTWLVNARTQGVISFQFGANGDKPVPADFDGDFKTDFAVFRPATRDWIIRLSATQSSIVINFGLSEDKPVPADYDGDRKADAAVFRPSNGTWYYRRSSDNSEASAQFGQAGDIPQPTDVDGDGRADFNVFRPSNSVFYFASSFDGRNSFVSRGQGGIPQPTSGFFTNNFYVYRPSDGAWFADGAVTQTPPNEIPVSYVLPVGN
jgi:hypothetical protein